MLSDEELLDRDTSDSIFANETPREDSPRTLTHHLINRFGISSKGGTETAINNTQALYEYIVWCVGEGLRAPIL